MSVKRILLSILAGSAILLATGLNAGLNASAGKAGPNGPSGTTSYLTSELQISNPTLPECDRYVPAVAYNYAHDEYLVVWHNKWPDGHRDVYARRVSGNGQLQTWFSVSAGTHDRFQPAVAYNAATGEYLVVWMYDAQGDATHYEVWGRRVAWDGSYMGPEFQIFVWANRGFWTPRVAWNSYHNEYMVIANGLDTVSGLANDVSGRRVMADGSTPYSGSPVAQSQVDMPQQGDIAYNVAADEYLVVWRRMFSAADGDIRGARLRGDNGAVISPGEFAINSKPEDQQSPAVTTNDQHRYLVVWQHAYPGPCCDWDIRGQELDVAGSLAGGEFVVAQSTDDEQDPAVAARPGPIRDYLAVWQRTTSSGETIEASRWGDVDPSFFEVASAAFWDNENPAVAWGRAAALIVYAADSQGDPTVYRHIYGRKWVPNAAFLPAVLRNK
jgi:hypothetical protein